MDVPAVKLGLAGRARPVALLYPLGNAEAYVRGRTSRTSKEVGRGGYESNEQVYRYSVTSTARAYFTQHLHCFEKP